MRPRATSIALLTLTTFLTAAAAQPAPPKPTGKPWLDMDYGPYLTATVESPVPKGNFAYKGITIRLDGDRAVVFDTDTLRYAAGWSGGFLELKGVVFDGVHWTYPLAAGGGEIAFANPVGPGWGKPGDKAESAFADDRFVGRDGRRFGPLPREWGRWNGLYLHEQRVILSYTLGGSDGKAGVAVLESPVTEKHDGIDFFTRTLEIAPSAQPLVMQVALADGPVVAEGSSGAVSWRVFGKDMLLALGCIGEHADAASWQLAGGNAQLMIAAHDKPVRVKVLIARAADSDGKALAAAIRKAAPPKELTSLTRGGPPRWPQKLVTEGKRGTPAKDAPWAIDTITWPTENPWRSWMRFGGFDFFRDPARAAICTWNGDVWLVTGLSGDLKQLTWQRIATGMFQPLGLRIVDEQIYVCCRDQITRLHDLNGDGETDYYENFNNDHQVTEHFHEFAMDLQTDKEGNFYYAKSARHALDSLVEQHGTLMKVSRDGRKSEIVANGFRAANGVGLGADGRMCTSDQEGHWMPANRINLLRSGGFYGNMFSYHRGDKPADYIRPVLWLPKAFDRSPAEQFFVDSDRWGLPRGSLLSTSYGTGSILHIAYQPVKDEPLVESQGAAVKLPMTFPTGIMRARFHPGDGQLYVAGLFGWAGDRTSPGGFWRIRHTGAKVHLPIRYEIGAGTITLGFTHPLDKKTAEDVGSYLVEAWNYKWTANYGSPEFKVSDGERGRDAWKVEGAALGSDGRTVTLHVPSLTKAMQVRIKYALESADGRPVEHDMYGSIFAVPKP